MFLFTTPAAAPRQSDPASSVVDAIRQGADRTGASFDYLLATAKRESALDPAAKAPTSSATGLFQFIEQTWLGVVRKAGAQAGLGDLAGSIASRSDGSLTVDDPAARQAILDLRKDPAVSSVMAGVLTQQNRDTLGAAIGREPTGGELYAAHVLGARGAADLIRGAAEGRVAASDFPDAAAANRGIFYDRTGRARSSAEVYGSLTAAVGGGPGVQTAAAPLAANAAAGAGLTGLFQTDRRAGPVSEAVAKIWRINNGARAETAKVVAFFPRSGAADAAPTPAAVPAAAATPADAGDAGSDVFGPAAPVPLPPPRPAALAAGRGGRGS